MLQTTRIFCLFFPSQTLELFSLFQLFFIRFPPLQKYLTAVSTIKEAILRSQNRAVRNTNLEMLPLYYRIGDYMSDNSRKGTWGTGAIEEISNRLREELPGLRVSSPLNIYL